MAANPLKVLQGGLGVLLQTEAFSDLVLCDSEGKTYHVHKAIICAQSKFFQKACEPGKFKEGEESKVDLTIGDSITISSLLDFLYTLDYGYKPIEGQADSKLLSHANVYVAADFYDVPELKEVAATKFQANLANVSLTGDEFPKTLEAIYTNTNSSDRILRDIALKFILDNTSTYSKTPGNGGLTINDVMRRVPELGQELTMRMLAELEILKPLADKWHGQGFRKVQCQSCLHIWADSKAVIPGGTHCPGCHLPKWDWDLYQVQ